jgi:hypothetical protein
MSEKQAQYGYKGKSMKETHAIIEEMDFSLLYDYDRLKLHKLSPEGKIKWFRLRMESLYIKPLGFIFDESSDKFEMFNNDNMTTKMVPEFWAFNITAFSALLNGMETFGAFMRPRFNNYNQKENQENFHRFLRRYMGEWDQEVIISGSKEKKLWKILWLYFRNCLAHGLRIKNGGVENKKMEVPYEIINGLVQINPIRFYSDLKMGIERYFDDILEKKHDRKLFLKAFKYFFPY